MSNSAGSSFGDLELQSKLHCKRNIKMPYVPVGIKETKKKIEFIILNFWPFLFCKILCTNQIGQKGPQKSLDKKLPL